MDSSESLVDLIFSKCQLVYGRDFSSRWEGMKLADVKADWRRELGTWLNQPQAIKHALENLPERPLTVIQFRALCMSHQESGLAKLGNSMTAEEKARADVVRRRVMAGIRNITPKQA